MELSLSLLLGGASSAFGQFTRFTNSSNSAVEPATTSIGDTTSLETTATTSAAPTETELALDLKNAVLGPGASFYPPPEGDSIYDFDRKRAGASDCVLEVLADGVVVAIEPINSSSQGTPELSSNPFRTGKTVEFTYRETCGSSSTAIGGIVGDIVAKLAPEGATSTPIPSIPIRTEAGTGTNSESATTNSGFETVIPTETATDTNSEGATTNSEGETIIPTQTNNEGATTNSEGEAVIPNGTATSTVSSTSSTATSPDGLPGDIGAFSLFGCVGSTAGFPSFTLAQSSESMDLGACAALCEGHISANLDSACYCGDLIDSADTSRVTLDLCDIECPGDDTQFCGGEARSEKLRARQNAAVIVTDSVTQTATDQETIATNYTTTITGALCTATQAATATLVCFAGKCYSSSSSDVAVYIFIEINGSDYDGQWVYISEPCSCADSQIYVPKFCSGGSSSSIKVYKPRECTPDNCNGDVPVCNGYDCHSQHNGGGSQHGGHDGNWNSTTQGDSNGGSQPSPNGGFSSGSNQGLIGPSGSGSKDTQPSIFNYIRPIAIKNPKIE
ncbi:hypothetical protein DER46DRAFT_625674 [Fusarium sp. MPI-SDFR-AT-0072]|nr:hypothetical protein DER46DRAFT_625674 [Fusarium sp. MPI-SDFR-AT-0072]